jgi:uncharacterized protein (DUF362 family)
MKEMSRRHFLELMGATAGIALYGTACSASSPARAQSSPSAPTQVIPAPTTAAAPTSGEAYLAVARGSEAAAITKAAVASLGGIERFVKSGNDVIIKPNICTEYHPAEYATTTNPTVVATLVTLCLGAGARRVRVMDMPFGGTPEAAYAISGIADAVQAAGGEMEVMSPIKYAMTAIPQGKDITEWEVYQDVLKADVLINVPIAKHHSLTRLTLGGKNLLGVILRPNRMHLNIGQRLADLASVVRPTLTVMDAVRILVKNGPTGGSLDDVKQTNTIVASHDMVAVDAFATTLFGLTGKDVDYVKCSADMGLGTLDLSSVKIEETNA